MNLKKTFFILALISVFFLLMLTEIPAKYINPNKITEKFLGKRVKITGEIKEIKSLGELLDIKIKNADIKIIVFTNRFIDLNIDETVTIEGKVSIYKGGLQIIADKIKIITY